MLQPNTSSFSWIMRFANLSLQFPIRFWNLFGQETFRSSCVAFWRFLCLCSSPSWAPSNSASWNDNTCAALRQEHTNLLKEKHGQHKSWRRIQASPAMIFSKKYGNLGAVWLWHVVTISCPSPLARLVATSVFQVTYVKPKTVGFCIDLCRKVYKPTRWTPNLDWGTGCDSPELGIISIIQG